MLRRAAALIACVLGAAAGQSDLSPVVEIPGVGAVRGLQRQHRSGQVVEEFLGIPYATAQRWEPPVPAASWTGTTRNATEYGSPCPASDCTHVPDDQYSEQCQFLNVFRPANRTSPSLPVMLFVHGGGYSSGCSNLYPGNGLVARSRGGVLVVTINYRVNVFGFLGSDSMRAADNSTGNWGLQDQRAALQWTQRHIAAFGGDPLKVTLFGQSAGAASVSCHLTMEKSFGLYSRVIVESGLSPTWAAFPMALVEERFSKVLKDTGCKDVGCLKAVPMAKLAKAEARVRPQLLDAVHHLAWGPAIDGVEMLQHPAAAMKAGKFETNIDFMSGSTRDEMTYFIYKYNWELNEELFDLALDEVLVNRSLKGEVRNLYSEANYVYPTDRGHYNRWWWETQYVLTDEVFTCPHRRGYKWIFDKGVKGSMYVYFLTHPTQTPTYVPTTGPGEVAVPHESDVPYVFDCPGHNVPDNCTWSVPEEQQLSHDVAGYWVTFAMTGSPGGQWGTKQYTPEDPAHWVLDVPPPHGSGQHFIAAFRTAQCDFWDTQLQL